MLGITVPPSLFVIADEDRMMLRCTSLKMARRDVLDSDVRSGGQGGRPAFLATGPFVTLRRHFALVW